MSRGSAAPGEEIAAFLHASTPDDDRYNAVARKVFAHQYTYNAPYRRFCAGRGVSPENVADWRDVPAVPAAAFKRFALTCAPESDCVPERGGAIFHSSGTTGADTSRHFLDRAALDLYRVSLREGFRLFVDQGGADRSLIALMPSAAELPNSSLSFMLESLRTAYGESRFYWEPGWQAALAADLQKLSAPVTIFGTAFAWVHLFDATEGRRFALPAGSIVVETGGFKGRSREVDRVELYALFTDRLGVPPDHCVSEYGMSEMASQFYDSALVDGRAGRQRPVRKVGPFWLRTRVMDPVTGDECAAGQPGLLAHYDLANLNSVLAIQTEDYGVALEEGGGFLLLGRAPGAVLRGCSLTAEDLLHRHTTH
jgi:hypothetical protein